MDSRPPSAVTTFQHETLPDAANYMRLLEVLDDDYSDTIKVRCRITTWSSDTLPSYHAISYAWGDPESNTTILINDKPFSVRKNCESVLKQARWHAKCRYYWVDAICIDQDSVSEKNKQVAMMGNIYKGADLVLACVGDHTDESRLIFQDFTRFSHFMDKSRSKDKSFMLRLYWRFGFFTTWRFMRACVNFTERPYFSRLWVLQELKNARQTSILCGRDVLSTDEFKITLLCLFNYLRAEYSKLIQKPGSPLLRQDAIRKGQRSNMCENSNPKALARRFDDSLSSIYKLLVFLENDIGPIELVELTFHLQCKIPKDKVYGIISLLNYGDDGPIMPDYTKSEFEVALELLHAIWNTELLRKENSSGIDLVALCVSTIQNLELHGENFPGVLEALKARGEALEGTSKEAEIGPKSSLPPALSLAVGYRVSAHDVTQSAYDDALLKYWNPSGVENIKVFLPHWTREGDWVVHMKEQSARSNLILVLREEADNSRMRIVGRGCAYPGPLKLAGTTFKILWDPEDILVCVLLEGFLSGATEPNAIWIAALNTGVCRRESPESSYAIELSQEAVTLRDG